MQINLVESGGGTPQRNVRSCYPPPIFPVNSFSCRSYGKTGGVGEYHIYKHSRISLNGQHLHQKPVSLAFRGFVSQEVGAFSPHVGALT